MNIISNLIYEQFKCIESIDKVEGYKYAAQDHFDNWTIKHRTGNAFGRSMTNTYFNCKAEELIWVKV